MTGAFFEQNDRSVDLLYRWNIRVDKADENRSATWIIASASATATRDDRLTYHHRKGASRVER
jgi:hypothetical protein